MSIRRGIKRLAIAIGLPWFAWWGYVGYANYQSYQRAQAEGNTDWLMMTLENLVLAITMGVILPTLLLVLSLVGWWVYRGFRSEP